MKKQETAFEAFFVFFSLGAPFGYKASELDPGQQAKASKVIDSAQFILNAIDEDSH